MQHWYVYYKVARDERDELIERVRSMQQRIAQAATVRVRLLERTDQSETTTVMEVYEDIDDAGRFAATLDAAVRASDLPEAHRSARRVERFQDT